MSSQIPSPCIKSCQLNSNDICTGCFRSIEEIIGWAGQTNNQKKQIVDRCQQRKLNMTQPIPKR